MTTTERWCGMREELRDCLLNLIEGLKRWEENPNEVPAILRKGHKKLVKLLLHEGKKAPVDLPALIALLQLPVSKWGLPFEGVYPLEAPVLVPNLGVSHHALEFLAIHESAEEAQAKEVWAIVQYCRGAEPPLEEKYRRVRTFLIRNPVVSAMKLMSFRTELQDVELSKLLGVCYEEITEDLDRYRICPRCGWTLEYRRDGWRCGADDLCGSLVSRKELEKWEPTGNLLRLKPGVYRYTMLPGLAELEGEEALTTKGYKVTLFPQVDRYDLAIHLGSHTVYLDMKDFSHPLTLANYFNRMQVYELEKYREDHIYVVIPQYRNKVYPGFARLVSNALLPHARYLRVINEKEIQAILEGGTNE